jgi:hypothetical protein
VKVPSDKVVSGELKEFCTFVNGWYGNLVDMLAPLGDEESTMVKREAFKQYVEKVGYPGDAGSVFDALNTQGLGALSVQEIRIQLQEIMNSMSKSSSSRTPSKGRRQKSESPERSQRAASKQSRDIASSFGSLEKEGTNGKPAGGSIATEVKGFATRSEESTRSSLHVADAKAAREASEPFAGQITEDSKDGGPANSRKGSKGRAKRKPSKERNAESGSLASGNPDDGPESLLSVPERSRGRAPSPDGDKPPTIRASVAVADVDGSLRMDDSFVLVRPHPYQQCDDDGRSRTFVYKGKLIEVPLLPLYELDEDWKESDKVSKGTGWGIVKSKVVGQQAKLLA